MKKIFTECPVEATLYILENKWKTMIIRDLLGGTKRFGELKKSMVGISQRALTMNLRFLEENSIISRKVYAEVPPKVEYTLTETGESLRPILATMQEWGEWYKKKHCSGKMGNG